MKCVTSRIRAQWLLLVTPVVIAASLARAETPDLDGPLKDPDSEFFVSTVSPILATKCLRCHRGDEPSGSLSFASRQDLLEGGDAGSALKPGDALGSPLYTRTVSVDGARPEMPEQGAPLTQAEQAALREWITNGAVWPDGFIIQERPRADASFWSFQPLAANEPPQGVTDPQWNQHPIDRFVWEKLAQNGLKPNPPAEPATFIRRATYDLTGLPPSPAEIRAFESAMQEDQEAAVRALIDRLLESPRYGEHWGRHWLDVVRFGESRGYERNEIITNLWPFRDYVIRSIQDDKSFQTFIQEHLAGDKLAPGDPSVEIGAAFLVAGPYDDVGNQNPEAAAQTRADQMDEMIRATSEAFLGLTVGCARCHDHKFDPIPSADYYALYATFAGVSHGSREIATPEQQAARRDQLAPLESRRAEIQAAIASLEETLKARASAQESSFLASWTRPSLSRYGTEEYFAPIEARYVRLTADGTDTNDPHRQDIRIDEFEVFDADDPTHNVALEANGATASGLSHEAQDFAGAYSASLTIDGKFGERWLANSPQLTITLPRPTRIQRVVFSSDRTAALPSNHDLTVFVGDYRLEVSLDGKTWTEVANSYDRIPVSEARKLARVRVKITTPEESERVAKLADDLVKVQNEIAAVPGFPNWWVGNHQTADGPFHIFQGGSPARRGPEVLPASLTAFRQQAGSYSLPSGTDEGERRLALGKWLSHDDNYMSLRVLSNRIWHYHFGRGIVETPSDFGFMGGRPSHPELLDWLAIQFRKEGWRLKPLHRLIMTSRTYRQSAAWNSMAADVDNDNRLLWRFSPRRLTAEELRDSILAVSGKLDLTIGGPGFRLYDYYQDNVATYVPKDTFGPETYRRSIYHHNARAARIDLMTEFDCPDPALSEPRRVSTTTPLQALTLLNHEFTLEMAKGMAERLERESRSLNEAIALGMISVWGREPKAAEIDDARKLVEGHGLPSLCRALLNSNEFLHVQ